MDIRPLRVRVWISSSSCPSFLGACGEGAISGNGWGRPLLPWVHTALWRVSLVLAQVFATHWEVFDVLVLLTEWGRPLFFRTSSGVSCFELNSYHWFPLHTSVFQLDLKLCHWSILSVPVGRVGFLPCLLHGVAWVFSPLCCSNSPVFFVSCGLFNDNHAVRRVASGGCLMLVEWFTTLYSWAFVSGLIPNPLVERFGRWGGLKRGARESSGLSGGFSWPASRLLRPCHSTGGGEGWCGCGWNHNCFEIPQIPLRWNGGHCQRLFHQARRILPGEPSTS